MGNRDDLLPTVQGGPFDSTGTVFTLRVTLQANHEYRFTPNRVWGGTFRNTGGVPLKAVEVRFRTRAAGASRPTGSPRERDTAR